MDLLSLILYGITNAVMVLIYLRDKGQFYKFPFWAGIIALGWFFPQAIGGYLNSSKFPPGAYFSGMIFAWMCTLALWFGFSAGVKKSQKKGGWLESQFDVRKLYWVGVAFCAFGFFFQWKLWSLPEEMLAGSQEWSGAAVKYLFFANTFKFGLLTLLLLYLSQTKLMPARLVALIIPCLGIVLYVALLRGRRSEMMNIVAYLLVSVWFVRRVTLPKWLLIFGLIMGLTLINGIKIYRSIILDKDAPIAQRIEEAVNADYLSVTDEVVRDSGSEFKNYIFYRYIYADLDMFDYGGSHWNKFIFNYVPAQLVGSDRKESLMIQRLLDMDPKKLARETYGYSWRTGTTSTGYCDAFGSFGWLGWVKFLIIGGTMGVLYRHAMSGAFLGQLLYLYILTTAMQSITHGTNAALVRIWIYFFMLCFPVVLWAKVSNGSIRSDARQVAEE